MEFLIGCLGEEPKEQKDQGEYARENKRMRFNMTVASKQGAGQYTLPGLLLHTITAACFISILNSVSRNLLCK